MAYSNITALQLGSLLQTVFTKGVHLNISSDYRDFEHIGKITAGSTLARDIRYQQQKSLGPAAVQYANPGQSARPFPRAQQSSIAERTATMKEIQVTIQLEYNMWKRAMESLEKYGEPLEIETTSKLTSSKRQVGKDLYGDGTGVIGTVASAAVTSPTSNQLVFTLSSANAARGFVGWFEYDDLLVLRSNSGGASALDTSLATEPAFWKVVEKNRDPAVNTVTLQGLDSNYAPVATISSISVQPTAGDVFYRSGQGTIPDLSSIADYGSATEVMAGLESLAANDGRTIHGGVMSGALSGTRTGAGGLGIDVKHIEKLLNQLKINAGGDRYRWKQLIMAPETHSSFIEGREADRRFQLVTDNKRGVSHFAYIHRNDVLECVDSEFAQSKRIWVLPEAKSGDKVLQYYGSGFETVKTQGGDSFMLVPGSGGGHVGDMVSYLLSVGVIVNRHPAAIGVIEDFVNT